MSKTRNMIHRPLQILFLVIGIMSGVSLSSLLPGRERETPKVKGSSLYDLLQEEMTFPDLEEELAACYDLFKDILRADERGAKAEADRAAEEFMKRLEDILSGREASTGKTPEQEMKRIQRELRQLAAETDLEAMFPSSSEERARRCLQNQKAALRQLELSDELESCYTAVLKRIGLAPLAATEDTEDRKLWRREIESFTSSPSEERIPLQTVVTIPAYSRRPFLVRTFCLDEDLLRPDDREELIIAGDAALLGLKDLEALLREAAANPDREIDIQKTIWEEMKKKKESSGAAPSGRPMRMSGSGGIPLADGVRSGSLSADIRTRDGFSSVEIIIENLGDSDLTVDVSGAILESGDSETQSLATAGVDKEQPPPAPPLKSPEERIEEILKKARDIIKKAIETVKNGDHSREALIELAKALRLAEAVGLDDEFEDGWDVLRDGLMKATRDAYKEYKENPWRENYDRVVDYLRALDDLNPPEGCEEEFQKMLDDVFGYRPGPSLIA